MDIKTSAIREEFNFSMFGKFNDIIFYENKLFIFSGDGSKSIYFNINTKICHNFSFLVLFGKISAVLFKNFILVSRESQSIFYLYDLMIDNYSKIDYVSAHGLQKFFFADNKRAYLWIKNGLIYESEENNPFQWNVIGNNDFGIQVKINEITYSYYMGNLYISFISRPKMYCYRFNKEEKGMELIYEDKVSL
ncbi:unnamed protein product [Blepharisma stoltei]|uniref:Uncharacterized protein n=1 Tax=Blepharisma stoltei TaxID=1481888 RepID=A0AAU9JJQ1_9CILI|nr:unnamed protein product [Blepharisma stoltei]